MQPLNKPFAKTTLFNNFAGLAQALGLHFFYSVKETLRFHFVKTLDNI
jgi:hypothetical protein